jgi:hypothetical protein
LTSLTYFYLSNALFLDQSPEPQPWKNGECIFSNGCQSYRRTFLLDRTPIRLAMFSSTQIFSVLLMVALVVVKAQDSTTTSAANPTSTSTLTPCVLACANQAAASSGCSSLCVIHSFQCLQHLTSLLFGSANIPCVCSSTPFDGAVAGCLGANCTSAEEGAALLDLQSICASGKVVLRPHPFCLFCL